MSIKKTLKLLFISLIVSFLTLSIFSYVKIKNSGILEMGDMTYATLEDIENLKNDTCGDGLISFTFDEDEMCAGQSHITSGHIIFKLFNIFKIKTIDTKIISGKEVYLGGNLLGFSIKTDGVIVVGCNDVLTSDGSKNAFDNMKLEQGDVILLADEQKIDSTLSLAEYIDKMGRENKCVELLVRRKNNVFSVQAKPVLDSNSNTYKLGLWIRDDASGLGTLTYVDQEMNFGALGHPISDAETGAQIDVAGGKIYSCSLIGIDKGEKGKPGKLRGVFLESKKNKGELKNGSNFGLFGKIEDKARIIDVNKTAKVGGRLGVKPGRAKIVSGISGVLEEYDIEIIKAAKQEKADDKSMVIKVVDPKLLELTGGIVQGMSGSPILQNGKIIGAVTHVFVSNPTKGYGVYMDWMLDD